MSKAPGFRTGRAWKGGVAGFFFYLPLGLILLLVPLLGALLLFMVGILFDAWESRALVEDLLPPLRSQRAIVRNPSWIVSILLLVLVAAPVAALVNFFVIAAGSIGLLAWWLVWRDQGSPLRRVLWALAACIATPVAFFFVFRRRASGWKQLVFIGTIVGWIDLYALLLIYWRVAPGSFGDGKYWFALGLSLWAVVIAAAFLLSAIVKLTALQQPLEVEAPSEAPGETANDVDGPWKHRRLLAAAALVARLGLWSAIEIAFIFPWISITRNSHFDLQESIQIYLLAAIAVLPVAVTSLIALFPVAAGSNRSLDTWIESHLAAAAASAVLLCLAVTVTFAVLNSPVAADVTTTILPAIAATAWVAGLSISLSSRLGQRLRFRTRWTYAGTIATIGFLTAIGAFFAAYDLNYSYHYHSPNDLTMLSGEFVAGTSILFAAVAFAFSGMVMGSWVLYPGLRAFGVAMERVHDMLMPLVGFISGYALIVLFFGAWYYWAYTDHADWFVCASAERTASTVQAVPCKVSPKPPNESDFMYFSINTALPLGYSRIKPADGAEQLQWATAAELIAGASWIVVVFAAMLHALQEQMIRRATEKQIGQLAAEFRALMTLPKAREAHGGTQPVPTTPPSPQPAAGQRQASRGGWIALGLGVLLAGGAWVVVKPSSPIIALTAPTDQQSTLGSMDQVDLTITNNGTDDLQALVVYLDGSDDWFKHHAMTNVPSCGVNAGLERVECGPLKAGETKTLLIYGQTTGQGYWHFEADVVDREGSLLVHPRSNSAVEWYEYITPFDPHQAMLQLSEIPPGYTITQDRIAIPTTKGGVVSTGPLDVVRRHLSGSSGQAWYGWFRVFTANSTTLDFDYIGVTIYVLPAGTDPGSTVSDSGCDLTFSGFPIASTTEVPGPASGSGHKACVYRFSGDVSDVTEYITADKFAFVDVAIGRNRADDTATLNEAVKLAQQQLLNIESQASH